MLTEFYGWIDKVGGLDSTLAWTMIILGFVLFGISTFLYSKHRR